MPKQVDHAARRREIAEAVVRLVTAKGVDAASLRTVAAEASVSMGAVQHYFTTKDEMLLFALEYGNGLLAERIQKTIAEGGAPSQREAFRLLCMMLLPLDSDGRAGARLWAAMIARGCVDEPTRRLATEAYANLTAFVTRCLTDLGIGREPAEPVNVAGSARRLVCVIEGLRWPVLFGTYTEQEALKVLDAELDQILGN
jgi:TetR/AcrR family transcriptional repressor of bet genes